MTKLTLVRHAESILNTQPELIVGRSNHAPLTVRGLYQASLLGAYFRETEQRFDAIFSSGAIRTNQTTQAIIEAAGFDQTFDVDERLQEVSQGSWEGRHRDETYTPERIRDNRLDDLDGSLPGAESVATSQIRMAESVRDMAHAYPDGTILVVTHGLATRGLAGLVRRQTKTEILAESTPNVSLTDIRIENGLISVGQVGKTVITE